MEGGSGRDLLQPCAGATVIYHVDVGVSREYWRELIEEEKNLGEMSAVYSLCLLRLREAVAELEEHRLERLHLGVNHSRLSSLRRRLLVEHGMLTTTVDSLPAVPNTEEVQRDEETIMSEEATAAEHLNAHRLAVQRLCVRVHSLDAHQERQAVDEMLRRAKELLLQIDSSCKRYSLRLRQTIEQIVEFRVENNQIRVMNKSLSSSIHDLQYRGRIAAPTQEGGVGPLLRPQNWSTKLCYSWMRGSTCRYGDRCRFVHSRQELHHRIPLHPLYRTKLCHYFLSPSGCESGNRCHYLHGRPPPQ